MMRCKGDSTRGFHKTRMMIYFYHSEKGNHFACPECARVAIAAAGLPRRARGINNAPSGA
jgi:hypothetical protein